MNGIQRKISCPSFPVVYWVKCPARTLEFKRVKANISSVRPFENHTVRRGARKVDDKSCVNGEELRGSLRFKLNKKVESNLVLAETAG